MMVLHQQFLAHDIGETVGHVKNITILYYRVMWQITNQELWLISSKMYRFTATSIAYINTLVGSNSF